MSAINVSTPTRAEVNAAEKVLQQKLTTGHDYDAYGRGFAKLRTAAQEASA